MKTPPLLLGAALLFWGWQTDFLMWAGAMAVMVESSRLIKFRLNFSDTDLNRIWDLCGLLFAGAYVFVRNSPELRSSQSPAFVFPQWLPFVFFPMILAQAFGGAETIGMKTFSWLLRWRKAESEWAKRRINFSYLYFAICLFGAGTTNRFGANERGFNWFYLGLATLVGLALLSVRPRRVPLPLWFCMLGLIIGGGFFAQQGLHRAQTRIETAVGSWIIRLLGRRHPDPNEGRTAIGHIGRLKLSGRIMLRVDPVDKNSVPDLLREATYVSYRNENWFAYRAEFSNLTGGQNDSWMLVNKKGNHGATIHKYLDNGADILPLPVGTAEITNLPAILKINKYGTVKVEDGPGFISYFTEFGPGETVDAPPRERDSDVTDLPEKERAALAKIADELQLASKTDAEKLQAIARFFENNFTYSTFITEAHVDPTGQRTPLTLFLEKIRSGHCEYFATATVLLARTAHIPARYATGYSVQESSKSGDTFIVRERHAHAWALVWKDGTWQNFDTTPASWDKVEEEHASMLEPLSDFWSRVSFAFSKWRYGRSTYQTYLIWALIPLVLLLVWRIVFNKDRKLAKKKEEALSRTDWPGLDSEFYLIEKRLAELGLVRSPTETWPNWRKRILNSSFAFGPELDFILVLHQRYRFDPAGISLEERERLTAGVAKWLNLAKETETGQKA